MLYLGVIQVVNNAVAMAKAIKLVLNGLAGTVAKTAPANDVIDMVPLMPKWAKGKYVIGDVRMHGGMPWRCCQDHDSTSNPSWHPGKVPALWAPYHATDAAHALPWAQPTGAQDAYKVGEHMVWTDGKTYRCNTNAVVHNPEEISAVWEVVG